MFMLNMLFNLKSQGAADPRGRFGGPQGRLPLNQSVNWLSLKSTIAEPDPSQAFDPEHNNLWDDLGPHGTLVIPNFGAAPGFDRANVAFRVAADPTGPGFPGTTQLQLIVSFGRPLLSARTTQASPFTDDSTPNGVVKTAAVFGFTGPNTTAGWFFRMGKIALRPPMNLPNGTVIPAGILNDRYEFSVGVIISPSGNTVGGPFEYFGEDPEMDVGQ
jgi:hypothetical protein